MLNSAILMGRLTVTPELKHTPNGIAFTSFPIAVERSYAKEGQERQTDFIDILAWRNKAEFICKYFQKGQMIALQGIIETSNYTDTNGVKRKKVQVVADQISFADSKNKGSTPQSSGSKELSSEENPYEGHPC